MGSESSRRYRTKAYTLFREGSFSEAEYYYKILCKEDPDFEAWYFRGLSFKYLDMFESALHCFDEARNYDFDGYNLWYHVGYCHYFAGNFKRALQAVNLSIHNDFDYYLAYLIRTMSYLYLNDYKAFKKSVLTFKISNSLTPGEIEAPFISQIAG